MIFDDRPAGFLIRERHHIELERAAMRALGDDNARLAYWLSDRRCRISPLPNSQIYLLRAEALFRLGDTDAALQDVAKAIEIDPDDVAATRRLMAWGDENQQQEAAAAILSHEGDWGVLGAALALLRDHGREAFARVNTRDGEITGWVAWLPGAAIEISLSSDTETYSFQLLPDTGHPLRSQTGQAANFRIPRPASTAHQFLHISQGGTTIATAVLPGRRSSAKKPHPTARPSEPLASSSPPSLTVIVPVFADYRATKACVDSLLLAVAGTADTNVVIVNDASPDPDVQAYLATVTGRLGVTILANSQNLGFVGAINRGLDATPAGDVILLNADTLVPADALRRLRDVVTATPGVGTATPLSNNGEFTSFPIKNTSNPLPTLEDVETLDRLAASANAGTVLDIPNGIGFCLYITRACLDVVSVLSDDFHRGYMEDVDLCLRAAEAGFRNICVLSVFVGHEGSRSFRQEKRSLVVRNLKVLEHRYPRYSNECAAFMLADPLRDSRGRLEHAMLENDDAPVARVIFCGIGAIADIAMARARALDEAGSRTLVVKFVADGPHLWAAMRHPGDLPPQSLRFDLAAPIGLEQFWKFLTELAPDVVELTDPNQIPIQVLALIRVHKRQYDILIANTGLADCSGGEWQIKSRWASLVDGAQQIIAAGAHAENFLRDIGLGHKVARKTSARRSKAAKAPAGAACLGIVVVSASADEFRFVKDLGQQLLRARPELNVIVIGATMDDLKLMEMPNVFVTGSIAPSDIPTLLAVYEIDRLVVGGGRTVFGHPIDAAASGRLPTVRFGKRPASPADQDLWIAPVNTGAFAGDLIHAWLGN